MSGAPERPDLSAAHRRPEARWWPVAVVLGTVVAVVTGGYVVAAALSVPAGPPVGVAGVVTVAPLSGWETSFEETVGDAVVVRLSRGSGSLDVIAVRPGVASTPEDLAIWYRDDVLSSQLDQLSVSDRLEPVVLHSGRPALRFGYIGVDEVSGGSVEGEVTLLLTASGAGVILDGFAAEGLLAFSIGDIRAMVGAAEVAP
jgi:hypothetical protein